MKAHRTIRAAGFEKLSAWVVAGALPFTQFNLFARVAAILPRRSRLLDRAST